MSGDDLLTTPLGFVENVLGLPLYDWQAKALMPLEDAPKPGRVVQISVVSPNEAGKSSRVVAGAAIYWLALHPQGKVVITTKDQKQLGEQIIPALEKQLVKFEGWVRKYSPYYKIVTPKGATLIAYTTDDAGRVEGSHSGSGEDRLAAPLLMIVDEAKSVAEDIFQAIDRCGYAALMLTSSPGGMEGTFYDSQTKNSESFVCVRAGLKDCPHIDQAKIDRIVNKWGEDHPFTQSAIYGKFMQSEDGARYAVSYMSYINCVDNPPQFNHGPRVWFCDFGEGKAEHVIAEANGNRVKIIAAWVEANKNAAAGRFIREFVKGGMKAEDIWGDASDKEMWQLLSDAGWAINRKNFGAPPMNKTEYVSWGAEAWHEFGIKVTKCELILDPEDEVSKRQLTTRRTVFTAKGLIGIEDKHFMQTKRKPPLPSPDRGDAKCGAVAQQGVALTFTKEPFKIPPGYFTNPEYRDAAENAELLATVGADAGL